MPGKGGNTIQVCIKLRPCEPGRSSHWLVKEGRTIQLAGGHAEPTVFDCVFDGGASNQEVFDRMAQHIICASMQGFNGTIFAYGQTSSGKTYTMMGDGQNQGVMVLAAKEIFQKIEQQTKRDFLLRASYIEIYNEKINDLLNKKNQDLKFHEAGNGVVTVNSKECIITSEDDLMRLICPVGKERTVGEAHSPERSGHSHAILRIVSLTKIFLMLQHNDLHPKQIIESWRSDRSDSILQSILNLVDLAGSERLSGDSPTGSRVTGGGHINKSLMFLSNVVKKLSDNNADNKYINFRDCKLTRFLQASLCGNAFTSIICTIKPSSLEESQSTLNFAMRAKKIRIKPQVNEMVSDATMIERVDREIQKLRDQLAEERQKKDNQLKLQTLEGQLEAEKLKILSRSISPMRRYNSSINILPAKPDSRKASFAGIPENSRLPRPQYCLDSLTASQRNLVSKATDVSQPLKKPRSPAKVPKVTLVPNKNKQPIPQCGATQAEVSALTASNQAADDKIKAYEEEVKLLNQTIARLETENRMAVDLKQQFESHKTQSKQLETHLFTTINEKDLAIEQLQQSLKEASALTEFNQAANDKIKSYEEEVKLLNQTVARLEMENRMAVDLKQKFDSHKAQSKQQETTLLTTINEKELTIEELQQSLKVLSRDVLRLDNMQDEYDVIQQKYNKLHEEYESLERTSNASEEECQKLLADNTRLQLEIGTLKERVEEAQRKLMEAPSQEVIAEEFKVKQECQTAEIASYQANFQQFREVYDRVSKQLWESTQENKGLREELRFMKASFVSTEQEPDSRNDLLEQFAKLTDLIHQIEIHISSGRLFTPYETGNKQDRNVSALKLCLESPKHIKGETAEVNAIDGVLLLKLQFAAESQEQLEAGDKRRLLISISKLEKEVVEKNSLTKVPEATISIMQNAPLKHRVMDELQLKIEYLEKQKDELQGTVRELQSEVERQLKQMQLRDSNIAELKDEIKRMGKHSSLLEINQQLVSRQRQELSDDALLIGQLQDRIEKLDESLKQAEARQEPTVPSPEYAEKLEGLRESLRAAKDELKLKEKQKTDEINVLKLEYMAKMERSENENRAQFREYSLELKKSNELHKREMLELKATLNKISQEGIDDLKAQHLAELGRCRIALKDKLLAAAENQKKMDVTHSMELEQLRTSFKNQITKAEDERNKALDELAMMRSSQEECARVKEEQRAQLEAVRNEHKELVASSKEQIQELQQKYDQLAIYTDNLRDEKSILQVKIDKADAQHYSTLRKLHTLEMQMDEMNQQKLAEKSDLEEKIETMTAKIGGLKTELQSARLKSASLDDLNSKHEDLKLSLSRATEVSSTLQEKVDSLQSQLLASEKEISSRDREKEELCSQLKHALEAKDTASSELSAMTTQLQAVEEKMASQAGKFEKELTELNSSINELQLKMKSLQERKDELESENDELKVKLRNAHNLRNQLEEEQKLCASLRTQLAELEATKTQLEEQMRNKESEFNQRILEMGQEVELGHHSLGELTKECDKLRCDLVN
ncbi:hypothetical protein KR054_012553 [Drosophila jambulina]|nr:hypothetical protein KR054_012553 [Drosophila jambulina]